jgi:predicted GIY-YIG superfamily endonuclease
MYHDERAKRRCALHRSHGRYPTPRRATLRTNSSPGFTNRYDLTQLVYYETFYYPDAAIAREKEIKGWRRSKKIALIESMNPRWEDMTRGWQNIYKPDAANRGEIPRSA